MLRVCHCAALAACLCAGSAARGQGAPIPITNAGFEANPVAMGCFAVFTPAGWTPYDPTGILDGGLDVVGGLHPEGSPYFPDAPEGDHVALVFLGGDIGGGPAGLAQTLGSTLQPFTTYTLSVEVGNIEEGQGPPPCDVFGFFFLRGFPGYRVELRAGGAVIAVDDNSLGEVIPDGEFRRSAIQAMTDASHPQLNQALSIRLINLNMIDTPEAPGIEVDFDDVRLTACTRNGDIDGDADRDGGDAAAFANVLLGLDVTPGQVSAADMDCSGTADGADIARFVQVLLAS